MTQPPPPGQPDFQPQQPYQPYQQQPQQSYQQQPYQGQADGFFHAPKRKGGGVGRLLTGIVIAAVVVAGGYFTWDRFSSEGALQVGRCITVEGDTNDDVDHTSVACDDADTYSYYVAEVHRGEATCTEGVAYQSTSSRRGTVKTKRTTCLIPQFAAGSCYKAIDDGIFDYAVASCDGADFKVVSVQDSSTATCTLPAEPASFTTPARTYCIEWAS